MKILNHPFIHISLNNLSPALNFLTSLLIVRFTDASKVADYYSLQAVYPILLFIFSVAPYISVKIVRKDMQPDGERKILPESLVDLGTLLPISLFLCACLAIPFIRGILKIGEISSLLFFSLIVIPTGVVNFLSGALLATDRPLAFSLKDPFLAIFKLTFVFLSVLLLPNEVWALFGAEFVAFLITLFFLWRALKQSVDFPPLHLRFSRMFATLRETLPDLIPSMLVTFVIAVLGAADVVTVKHNFPSDQAGIYVIHGIIAKIPQMAFGVAGILIFSKLSQLKGVGRSSSRQVIKQFSPIILLVLGLTGIIFGLRELIFKLLYGLEPDKIQSYFGLILLHALLQSAILILLNGMLAKNLYKEIRNTFVPVLVLIAGAMFLRFATINELITYLICGEIALLAFIGMRLKVIKRGPENGRSSV